MGFPYWNIGVDMLINVSLWGFELGFHQQLVVNGILIDCSGVYVIEYLGT